MPSVIRAIFPEQVSLNEQRVEPGKSRTNTLLYGEIEVVKLVLVHCQPDDDFTLVYEKEVPAVMPWGNIQQQYFGHYMEFIEGITPDNYTARVDRGALPHFALLESEKLPGMFGLVVRHMAPNRF